MPRADIVGEAEFDDMTNGLHATVRFGKVEGSSSMVLNRTDAFCGTLYEDISRAVANTMLEPSKVRPLWVKKVRGGGGKACMVCAELGVGMVICWAWSFPGPCSDIEGSMPPHEACLPWG